MTLCIQKKTIINVIDNHLLRITKIIINKTTKLESLIKLLYQRRRINMNPVFHNIKNLPKKYLINIYYKVIVEKPQSSLIVT